MALLDSINKLLLAIARTLSLFERLEDVPEELRAAMEGVEMVQTILQSLKSRMRRSVLATQPIM